jgi:hypothetical protein
VALRLLYAWKRDAVLTTVNEPAVTTYRIEISGWDKNGSFFVENTDLEWSEESGKRVQMSREVRNGAIIFVRLLQGPVPTNSYPVAYQVECLQSNMNGKNQEFRLIQLHPKR